MPLLLSHACLLLSFVACLGSIARALGSPAHLESGFLKYEYIFAYEEVFMGQRFSLPSVWIQTVSSTGSNAARHGPPVLLNEAPLESYFREVC